MKTYNQIKEELKGVDRSYPDGTTIPKELPPFYQVGDKAQNCGNCKYYVPGTKMCILFKAKVKPNYWCKKWIKMKQE